VTRGWYEKLMSSGEVAGAVGHSYPSYPNSHSVGGVASRYTGHWSDTGQGCKPAGVDPPLPCHGASAPPPHRCPLLFAGLHQRRFSIMHRRRKSFCQARRSGRKPCPDSTYASAHCCGRQAAAPEGLTAAMHNAGEPSGTEQAGPPPSRPPLFLIIHFPAPEGRKILPPLRG